MIQKHFKNFLNMKIKVSTKNVTIALLILQCIPPLFYLKYLNNTNVTMFQKIYCWYGFFIASYSCIALLIGLFYVIISMINGDIQLFKPFEIKLGENSKEIDNLLSEYGKASMDNNKYQMNAIHKQLEELGYFKN